MLNTGVLNGGCWLIEGFGTSSLHYVIFLSFCSFSYSGVCSDRLKLSIYDVVAVKNSSNGNRIGNSVNLLKESKESNSPTHRM